MFSWGKPQGFTFFTFFPKERLVDITLRENNPTEIKSVVSNKTKQKISSLVAVKDTPLGVGIYSTSQVVWVSSLGF